jgi:hypothetical protein
MFGRKKKYEILVPLDTAEPEVPRKWPYGWADCPTCNNGRRVEDDVCMSCAAEGKTYDWTAGTIGLTYEEVQRIKNPVMPILAKAGDTLTWSCNYEVRERYEFAKYRCPFRVNYKVKKDGLVDMGDPPEAMRIHIWREKHYNVGAN